MDIFRKVNNGRKQKVKFSENSGEIRFYFPNPITALLPRSKPYYIKFDANSGSLSFRTQVFDEIVEDNVPIDSIEDIVPLSEEELAANTFSRNLRKKFAFKEGIQLRLDSDRTIVILCKTKELQPSITEIIELMRLALEKTRKNKSSYQAA